MESFRYKLGIIVSFLLFAIFIPYHWYSDIDKERIYTDNDKVYLSNSEKNYQFGPVNVDRYEAYWKQSTTYKETRTNTPFVWKTEVLGKTKKELFTVNR